MHTATAPSVRMLIVSDDAHLRSRLQDFFGQRAYHVLAQTYGTDMPEQEVSAYDVLLLDDELPDRKGLGFLESHARGAVPPKLMLLSGGRREPVLEAFQLGAADCVTKPFYMEELGARVQAVLRRTLAQSRRMAR